MTTKNAVLMWCSIILLMFSSMNNAVIMLQGSNGVVKPSEFTDYYDKYAEIHLNSGQSKVIILGTINTSRDGYDKFLRVANGLLESIKSPDVRARFNTNEFYLINVGDYPYTMPYTAKKSEFFRDVGEKYRGGGTTGTNGKVMVFQSEEFICKMGVITRYYKPETNPDDLIVRRWDNPIHEIGHWIEIYGYNLPEPYSNYQQVISNLPDFNKVPLWLQRDAPYEIFTILVTAWFDAQSSYPGMPKNRLEFRNSLPDYYKFFQAVFDESKIDIGQYCENEAQLRQMDSMELDKKRETVKARFGKYTSNVIINNMNIAHNTIQAVDSVYNLNYRYVINDKFCPINRTFASKDNTDIKSCAKFCDEMGCSRFNYNLNSKKCSLFNNSDKNCDGTVINFASTSDLQYIKHG